MAGLFCWDVFPLCHPERNKGSSYKLFNLIALKRLQFTAAETLLKSAYPTGGAIIHLYKNISFLNSFLESKQTVLY